MDEIDDPNYGIDMDWIMPERFTIISWIGQGSYGSVCAASDVQNKCCVAVKKLSHPFETAEYAKCAYRELAILSQLKNGNIISLVDAYTSQSSVEEIQDLYLVTPLMDCTLEQLIKAYDLHSDIISLLAYQIMRALKYLHGAKIIHRDLKPANVAVDATWLVQIIDFGMARQQTDLENSPAVVTQCYRAPEIILRGSDYNSQVDIWSVACILAEMNTREILFNGINSVDQVRKIINTIGMPGEEFLGKLSPAARDFVETLHCKPKEDLTDVFPWASTVLLDLLSRMLLIDPDNRITAAEALAHPYFQEYHNESNEPVGEPWNDPLLDTDDVTLEQWKESIWNLLNNQFNRV